MCTVEYCENMAFTGNINRLCSGKVLIYQNNIKCHAH